MATEQSLIDELAAARSRSANDSQLYASLQQLAQWYGDHRQPGRARPLVQELWTMQRQTLGELHEQTLHSLSWLVSLAVSLGRLDRADQLLGDFAARCVQVPPHSVVGVTTVLNQQVELDYQRGRFDAALANCRRVMKLLAPRIPATVSGALERPVPRVPSRTQLVRARNNLAALYVARGEYEAARRAFVRNLREAQQRLDPGDPALVVQTLNLASVLRLTGRLVESERLTAKAVRQCQRRVGWWHALVAQGLTNLGAYRLQAGRAESAVSLLQKALRIRRRLHPSGHVLVARTRRQLAEAQLALGRLGAAERLLDRTIVAFEKQQQVDEIQLALSLCSLGFVYLATGRHANAERTLNRAHEIQQRRLPPNDPQRVQTLNGLGSLNAARQNFDAAQSFHRQALALTEQIYGSDHSELTKTLVWLGEVALARGELGEAKRVLDRALSLREQAHGLDHPLVAEVLTRSGQLALAEGLPARALSIGARAMSIYSKAAECPPLARADLLAVAAESSRRLQRLIQAEALSTEELTVREGVVGAEHVSLLPAIKRLAQVHLARGKHEEGERALRLGLAVCEKTLGMSNVTGIKFAESLARLCLVNRRLEETDEWMERTVKMCQRCYGNEAEQVADALLGFSGLLRNAQLETKADEFERRAIDIRNRNCHVLL